jgi:hypothetical protein
VAKGVANRETAKQAAQAPAYQPLSEEAAKSYARTQMSKAAQQGRANTQQVQPVAQPAQMQAGQLWQAQSIDPETQKILAQKKQERATQAMTASQARDEYWRRNLGNAQQDLVNGALDFGE